MAQTRDGLGLVQEPAALVIRREETRLKNLDRHDSPERDLAGLVDNPHAAAAKLADDVVAGASERVLDVLLHGRRNGGFRLGFDDAVAGVVGVEVVVEARERHRRFDHGRERLTDR